MFNYHLTAQYLQCVNEVAGKKRQYCLNIFKDRNKVKTFSNSLACSVSMRDYLLTMKRQVFKCLTFGLKHSEMVTLLG